MTHLRCLILSVLVLSACRDKLPTPKPPLFSDAFDRAELGPSWKSTAPPGTYRIESGELGDGQTVESVLLPRDGLCVSTQVGCAVGCVFCMTGQGGLVRQVSSGEIVAQVALALGGREHMFGPEAIHGELVDGMLRPLLRGTLAYTGMTVLPPFIGYHISYLKPEARTQILEDYQAYLGKLETLEPLRYPRMEEFDAKLYPLPRG